MQINSLINNKKIYWIASLRGLLVFLVFFSHLTTLPIPKDLMFIIGRIGVAGFFLISGYLAVTSLEKRSRKTFLLNRFIRLYPIYWLLLLMTFLLSTKHDFVEFIWNFTLFEEFVGYEAMIGSSWMLPIMVFFFLLLALLKNKSIRILNCFYYLICIGSIVIGLLRYTTNKPFPTALCLLICVGLIDYIQKKLCNGQINSNLIRHIIIFEITLIIASALSYGEKVYWYFIAYNLGFTTYFLFYKYNIIIPVFDKLGELGFTFFLGAGIPIQLIKFFIPNIEQYNYYMFCIVNFILAITFSYIVTKWCEKPLLKWFSNIEKRLS